MAQTVLLTGVTGFIARHIAARLLDQGFVVRGTLRDPGRAQEVRDGIRPALTDADAPEERLSFVPLDLSRDEGWDEAMAGADVLMHTASPFPFTQPKDEAEVIRPAVDGTLRAFEAAQRAGVRRVVMTSSTVSVVNKTPPEGRPFDERDWSDLEHPGITPYAKSKTLAERAAWEFTEANPEMALTIVNPGFVLGPPLGDSWNTSLGVIERILQAKDPMLPRFGFTSVDVRDVAEAHVRALTGDGTVGKRFLAVNEWIWFVEMAQLIKDTWPERKVPTKQAPDLLLKAIALFDPSVRQLLPDLGKQQAVSNRRAQDELGMTFRPVRPAVIDSAEAVIAAGRV
ncbi:SDR family oxidoreductase [Aestuariibius sp. 2305UL40-4]|uniref:SDR family oxidoreductase n=1 Tax=Aestuariibius violaceus TaxID=3234132 RepID=UPI00345E1697